MVTRRQHAQLQGVELGVPDQRKAVQLGELARVFHGSDVDPALKCARVPVP